MSNTDDQRATVREKLASTLGTESSAAVVVGIESAMSHALRPGGKDYMTKARSLISNLKGNGGLRQRVLSGAISPEDLVAASAHDLASDHLKMKRLISAERFASSRSLGSSSDRIVGWQAGTKGKLELPSELPSEFGLPKAPSEAEQEAPAVAKRPPPDPPDSASKSSKRRRVEPQRLCSAGYCDSLAESEGEPTLHPRLHMPLCLGHRSAFMRFCKAGWPSDEDGLEDRCQWCCGELLAGGREGRQQKQTARRRAHSSPTHSGHRPSSLPARERPLPRRRSRRCCATGATPRGARTASPRTSAPITSPSSTLRRTSRGSACTVTRCCARR